MKRVWQVPTIHCDSESLTKIGASILTLPPRSAATWRGGSAAQVGFTRLGPHLMPNSGRPEFGEAPGWGGFEHEKSPRPHPSPPLASARGGRGAKGFAFQRQRVTAGLLALSCALFCFPAAAHAAE